MNALPGRCLSHHPSSPLVCTLPAGHAGPHQAQGLHDRVLAEWTPAAEVGAA